LEWLLLGVALAGRHCNRYVRSAHTPLQVVTVLCPKIPEMLEALPLLAINDMYDKSVGFPRNRSDRHETGRRLPLDPATQKIVALQTQYHLYEISSRLNRLLING
jgi:hypothetical protein